MQNSEYLNPARVLADLASREPGKVAIRADGFEISLKRLVDLSLIYSARMHQFGVTRGKSVVIETRDPLVVLPTVFACAMLGAEWAHLEYRETFDLELPSVEFLFSTERISGNGVTARIGPEWNLPPNGFKMRAARFPSHVLENQPWLIFQSSGTTGVPKSMRFSMGNMWRRIDATAHEFRKGNVVACFLFEQSSAPSLIRSLSALLNGSSIVISADPTFWEKACVTHVYGSPTQIRYLLPIFPQGVRFRKVLVGGAFLDDQLTSELLDHFDTVINTYGATETSVVLHNKKTKGSNDAIHTETTWFDSEVEIVDTNGVPQRRGTAGIVRVRNEYLAPGYLDHPQATALSFKDGWFLPGDEGRIESDDTFVTLGRQHDVVNREGLKINLLLVDAQILATKGVRDAASFIITNETDGIVEMNVLVISDDSVAQPDIRRAIEINILSSIGKKGLPDKVVFTDSIPRKANGKIDRDACAARALIERERRKKKD